MVASAKVERAQVEQLARALRVPLLVGESGAALFRRCLEAAQALEESERARARVVVIEAEGSNADALAALETFRTALGGGEGDQDLGPPRAADSR